MVTDQKYIPIDMYFYKVTEELCTACSLPPSGKAKALQCEKGILSVLKSVQTCPAPSVKKSYSQVLTNTE